MPRTFNAPHCHTKVMGLHHHCCSFRVDVLYEEVHYVFGEFFLDRESSSEIVNCARKLGEPENVCLWNISEMGLSIEGKNVMCT